MINKILVITLVFFSLTVAAQRNNSSPYSFFGIGDRFSSKTTEQASMGGIGAAYKTNHYLNFINPAANANLRFATYGIGGISTNLTLKETDKSQSSSSTSLQYISIGFPIGKKAGFSMGLEPQSTVGYSLVDQVNDDEGNAIEITKYSGNGGSSRLYSGFGVEIAKGLSLGFEAAFIFGTIDNSIVNNRKDVFLSTKSDQYSTIRGGKFTFGMQYQAELSNKLQVNLATVLGLEDKIHVTGTQQIYSFYTYSGTEVSREVLSTSSIKGYVKNPLKTIFGVGLGKSDKWYAALNYKFQGPVENRNHVGGGGNGYKYGYSERLSIGGFYTPRINSISNYWERVTYRAGLRFEDTGLQIKIDDSSNNFTPIKDFGINLGLGLPLGNKLSNVNVGLEYGKKGTTDNNLIQENYFNLRLSLSLNDIWFIKRKID
ncbi:hypothetical protein [Tenacibaculum sp. UWU-22]|uniref:hypothetical protein n=1 Tax=Tenacibaculum sp. UWU-22 TaxID=3234187 RepID=UPI0034DB7C3D